MPALVSRDTGAGWRDVAELVRLPAALSVPGDTLAGMAATGAPMGGAAAALPLASVSLYWAGMALNDYADRELDATERPERPIPSGRISPQQALGLAGVLTAAGVGIAAAVGGRRGLMVATALAGSVWGYDMVFKEGPLGPAAMASARSLDVMLGAGGSLAALPSAAVMGAHTAAVTYLSRGEVSGSDQVTAGAALATTAATALAVAGRKPTPLTAALATLYATTVGTAQWNAATDPTAGKVRAATGAGIRGMIPLQAALIAKAGRPKLALGLLVAGPIARAASKVVSPT